MEHLLKRDLEQTIGSIENDRLKQGLIPGYRFTTRIVHKRELVEKAWTVFTALRETPYLSSQSVCKRCGLDRDLLALIYKMIQRSNICQDYLRHSDHQDYFTVLKHYFNNSLYNVVFFVGTNCPSRCIYCPSVRIDSNGTRHLKQYNNGENGKLTEQLIDSVFADLAEIKNDGTAIMIKISGGLEPLTDIDTMKWIVNAADRLEIPVKLFSNGLLLNSPERRNIALKTEDIRISLSTTDERQYQYLCFSSDLPDARNLLLARLKANIRSLVQERAAVNPSCKIGFNCIVRPENQDNMVPLMELARGLGIDYVDFKPDYFSTLDESAVAGINDSVRRARTLVASGAYGKLFVNFTGSLSRSHLYWQSLGGTCNPLRQSDFKIFITPYGHCSPVHHGAFPHYEAMMSEHPITYSIGEISNRLGLIDILSHPSPIPEIELSKLNPFELMLSLEINREEEDKAWGLPLSVSPYHPGQSDQLPAELFFRFTIRG